VLISLYMQEPDRTKVERREYDPVRREIREERYEEHHHVAPGVTPVVPAYEPVPGRPPDN